ncbi:hypothetical protein T12_1552 [Trichinella patagoniensis]|uniref:Uncharacterized protein n=1 Tax=Trichinella patagoniensis TaxID=990121 RepID=A0A0V0Z599_9BILA|nr:hypothetical protein T12_1552 [Trichinella patagoniensis]
MILDELPETDRPKALAEYDSLMELNFYHSELLSRYPNCQPPLGTFSNTKLSGDNLKEHCTTGRTSISSRSSFTFDPAYSVNLCYLLTFNHHG